MFGASELTIGYSIDYLDTYMIGIMFSIITLGMNPFINTQGFSKISMMTVGIGAIINIILDPIFIFILDMGVSGAALATIIAQGISSLWVVKFLCSDKSIIRLRKKYIRFNFDIIKNIMSLGMGPFMMQSTDSLVLMLLNSRIQMYGGDLAVSAMTIITSISSIVTLPISGTMQGAQPIISYNYGAKNINRVKETFKVAGLICIVSTSIMWASIMIMPEMFVKIFSNSPELVNITSWSMRIYFGCVFMLGIQGVCQNTFLALGQARISLVLVLLRKIIFLTPLIYILPLIFEDKLFAVLLAQPIADFLAVSGTAICFYIFYKKTFTSSQSLMIKK